MSLHLRDRTRQPDLGGTRPAGTANDNAFKGTLTDQTHVLKVHKACYGCVGKRVVTQGPYLSQGP